MNVDTAGRLDLQGKTITTPIVFAVHEAFAAVGKGGRVEVVTDTFAAIETDIRAWCRTTGNRLVDVASDGETWQSRLRTARRTDRATSSGSAAVKAATAPTSSADEQETSGDDVQRVGFPG